jgi:hypothetical protein
LTRSDKGGTRGPDEPPLSCGERAGECVGLSLASDEAHELLLAALLLSMSDASSRGLSAILLVV